MSQYPKSWPVGGHPEAEAKVRQLQKSDSPWLRASGPGWVAEKQGALSNVKVEEGGPFVVLSWVEGFYDYDTNITPVQNHWVILDASTLQELKRGHVDYGTFSMSDLFSMCAVATPNGFVQSGWFPRPVATTTNYDASFYKAGPTLKTVFEANTGIATNTKRVFATKQGEFISYQGEFLVGNDRNYFSEWRKVDGETGEEGVLRIPAPSRRTTAGDLFQGSDHAYDYADRTVGIIEQQTTRIQWVRWVDIDDFTITGSRRYAASDQPNPYPYQVYDFSIGVKPLRLGDDTLVAKWGVCIERRAVGTDAFALRFYNRETFAAQRLALPFGDSITLPGANTVFGGEEPQAVTCTPRGVLVAIHSGAFDTIPYSPLVVPMDHIRLQLYNLETGELVREKSIKARKINDENPQLPHNITPEFGRVQMYTVWP